MPKNQNSLREIIGSNNLLDSFLVSDNDNENHGFSPSSLLILGDNAIIIAAIMGIILSLDTKKKKSPNDKYYLMNKIHEIVNGRRYITLGNAIDIIEDLNNIKTLPGSLLEFASRSNLLYSWLELRKEIKQIRKGIRLLKKKDEIRKLLFEILKELRWIKDINLTEEGIVNFGSHKLTISPFIKIIKNNNDNFLTYIIMEVDEADEKVYYYNAAHDDMVSFHLGDLDFHEGQQRIINMVGDKTTEIVDDYYGMFADSYPAITRLAKHICENTEKETQRELWVESSCQSQCDIKNLILLDIIAKGPKQVLLDVAMKEKGELEGYLQHLLVEDKSGETYSELVDKLKKTAIETGQDYNDLLASTVARKFGINVKTIGDELKGIKYYKQKIEKQGDKIIVATNVKEIWPPVTEAGVELEKLFRELNLFYGYFKFHDNKGAISHGQQEEQWEKYVLKTKGNSLGNLVGSFRDVIDPTTATSEIIKIFGNRERLQKFLEIYNGENYFGHGRNIVAFRNYCTHKKEDSKLFPLMNQINFNEISNFAELYFETIKQFLRIIMDYRWRIFPYKLTFTVYSITDQGIHRCNYKTDVFDDDIAKDMIIFTDEKIDFNEIYYCLPNYTRSNRKIWVKPFLVKASEFDF